MPISALEILERTDGRGADAVIDAVGTEAHGAPIQELLQKLASRSPGVVATKLMEKVGSDRTSALHAAISSVRRGGTLSIVGVYGGAATPMPMMDLFDKQIQIRMGQANVKSWIDEILPLVSDDSDPLGTEDFATHTLPLAEAPGGVQALSGEGGRRDQDRPEAVAGWADAPWAAPEGTGSEEERVSGRRTSPGLFGVLLSGVTCLSDGARHP